jgi:hypothetical protein
MPAHPLAERLRGLGLTAMGDEFVELQNTTAADDLSREELDRRFERSSSHLALSPRHRRAFRRCPAVCRSAVTRVIVPRPPALVREWTAILAVILVPPVTSSERRLAYPNLSFD